MYEQKIEGMTYELTELSALRHRNAKTLAQGQNKNPKNKQQTSDCDCRMVFDYIKSNLQLDKER